MWKRSEYVFVGTGRTSRLWLILLATLLATLTLSLVEIGSARLVPPAGAAAVSLVPAKVDCSKAPSSRLVNGINIDKTCQRAYFVRNGEIVRKVRVSTGKPGYATRSGYFRIYRRLDRWAESKIYKGAMMYRPMFFSGGQAMHGSVSDSLVKPYPASHGCVRMLHRDVDWLWRNGWGIGTRVHVFNR